MTGLRVLVTATPTTADGPACTPELAAWLITHGHAIALTDETTGDPRQWLHLPAPHQPHDRDDRHDLVDALYAERFTPRVAFRSVRAAAGGER